MRRIAQLSAQLLLAVVTCSGGRIGVAGTGTLVWFAGSHVDSVGEGLEILLEQIHVEGLLGRGVAEHSRQALDRRFRRDRSWPAGG